MSMLPAGASLKQLVPDLDTFLYDPAGYLKAEPLVIGPRRMLGPAAMFAFPGLALIFYWLASDRQDPEPLVVGVGLELGAMVWLVWSMLMVGHRLVLHPDGVEVCYRDTAVWCPWALFNAEGAPFVPESDSPHAGLTLPVNAEAIPHVELRQNGSPVRHGRAVRARQLIFSGADEMILPARYALRAEDLGFLLMQLGSRLGRQLPGGVPPPEASEGEVAESLFEPDDRGWMTVRLTRLQMPPRCCMCLHETAETLEVRAQSQSSMVMGFMLPTIQGTSFHVPLCPTCRQTLVSRQHQGGLRGLQLGALAATLLFVFLTPGGALDMTTLVVLSLGVLAVGSIIGFVVGTKASALAPVQVRRYSPAYGAMQIRFLNPEYSELVQEMSQGARKG